jgi:hypothetical protein
MTDIWRGIVLSGYMRESSLNTVIGKLGFRQDRNEHNLVSDFLDEVPGHEHNRLIRAISDRTWKEIESCKENWKLGVLDVYKQLIASKMLDQLDLECLTEFTKIAADLLNKNSS